MLTVVFDETCVDTPEKRIANHLYEVNAPENIHENGLNGKDINKTTIGTGVEFGSYDSELWFD